MTARTPQQSLELAAEILRNDAHCLHASHTINGCWPACDPEAHTARLDHDQNLELAAELLALAKTL